jgi:hypothetical protein
MTLAPAAISHLALSKFFSDVRHLAFSKTGPEPLKAVAEPGSALRNAPFADLCVEELDPEVRRVLFSQIPARTCRVTRTLGPQPTRVAALSHFPATLGHPKQREFAQNLREILTSRLFFFERSFATES